MWPKAESTGQLNHLSMLMLERERERYLNKKDVWDASRKTGDVCCDYFEVERMENLTQLHHAIPLLVACDFNNWSPLTNFRNPKLHRREKINTQIINALKNLFPSHMNACSYSLERQREMITCVTSSDDELEGPRASGDELCAVPFFLCETRSPSRSMIGTISRIDVFSDSSLDISSCILLSCSWSSWM